MSLVNAPNDPLVLPSTIAALPALKQLGQNFLRDRRVIARIVAVIAPQPGETLVEIGPGRGALTLPLLESVASWGGRLTVIEYDRALAHHWQQVANQEPRLAVLAADALTVSWQEFSPPLVVVGNLPYHISTPLLFHVATAGERLARAVFMLQREVVQRLAAAPGSKTYGRLSVMLQRRYRIERCFDVPPQAFWPVPKVVSSVVRLTPLRPDPYPGLDEGRFAEIVKAAFLQRRKTLANALKGVVPPAAIVAAGIDPGARAETLRVSDFVALTRQAGAPYEEAVP